MENEQHFETGKIALWIGTGCIVLVIGMVLGCVSSIGGLLWLTRAPQNVAVSVDAPIQLEAGDKAEFVVNVTNHNEDMIRIKGIDIGADYLHGITIVSVTPDYENYFPPDETIFGEAFQNYYFSIPIEPGDTVSVTFSGKTIASGDFGGSVEICIDSDFSCISKVIRTVVK